MRRALFLSLAIALLFGGWALPASGHEGADQAGHAGALSRQNQWMTTWMNTAAPVAENVEHLFNDRFDASHVVAQGNRLYVGWYGEGFRIYDISNGASPKLIGFYNAETARADAVPDATRFNTRFGRRHIAVLNGTNRTPNRSVGPITVEGTAQSEFLDVTDPSKPKVLARFIGPADGEAHNGDISDRYKLWLPSGGTGDNGLRIYNLRPLAWDNPGVPRRLFPPQACRDDANIACDPVTLWANSPYRRGRPIGPAFTHTHDKTIYEKFPVKMGGRWVRRDIILLAEGGSYATGNVSGSGSVFVIDITNRRNPVVLLRWLHPTGNGHTSLRYTHEAQFLQGDRRVMVVTDEDLESNPGCATKNGGSYAVRLSANLRSATELSEWFIPAGTPASVCSVHVFSSLGKTVFFGAYNAGLQVVDYSDPANPKRIGQFIAEGTTAWGALYYRGFIYVSDMSRGLDVFRFTG